MNKFLLTIIFINILTVASVGQYDAKSDFGFDILKEAENSFCNEDTTQTIKILENYIDKFPDIGTTILIGKRLSDFYLENDKTELAVSLLKKSLEIKPIKGYFIYKDSCGLYTGLDPATIEADICLTLSKIYTSLEDDLTALEFLNLADTKYLPYNECGNGMTMYQTKLSLIFADYYLNIGDTISAINRLLDFFLSNEAYEYQVAVQLKNILLLKYSQAKITEEIKNGISNMKIVSGKRNEPEKILHITFFGHTIRKRASTDIKIYKDFYKVHRSILLMTKE